ncbi:MAG: HDIG domain-containing protein, partial [Candidatus Hydrogenedentes bacterium]|nr:HDIG domain-containing protein [Candidatus Hydrogenedentota bacterium]
MLGIGTKKNGRPGYFGPQESPSLAYRKERLQRLIFVLAFVVLVAVITKLPALRTETARLDIDSETIASETIRAMFAFDAIDLEATREKRDQAAALVPVTYKIDTQRVDTQLQNFEQRVLTMHGKGSAVAEAVRRALLESNSLQSDEAVVAQAVVEFSRTLKEDPLYADWPDAGVLATWLMPDPATIPDREFEAEAHVLESEDSRNSGEGTVEYRLVRELIEPETETIAFINMETLAQLAQDSLDHVLTAGVIQPGKVSVAEGEKPPRIQIMRSRVFGDLSRAQEDALENIPTPDLALTVLRDQIATNARTMEKEDLVRSVDWERVQNATYEMAKSSVTDTLFYDEVVTEANREFARDGIEPVMRSFDVNEIIQDDGRPWTDQTRSDVKTYWGLQHGGRQSTRNLFNPVIANSIFVFLLLLALLRAMPVLTRSESEERKAINVMLLIVCSTLVLGRVISYFESSGLVVPIMAGAILLTILTNARIASVGSTLAVLLLSVQYHYSWEILMISGTMCFTGISSMYVVRKRGDMTSAAIKATFVGLITAVAVTLALGTIVEWQTLQGLTKIALNGTICLFIVPGLLSPLERLFGITTDIQLLEYSDLNNDLLRRLAIEVPATYAHSLMLGQLAETTADAIGANGLLARVSAYYHDIGKLRRPEYFSENQTGHNIHDELSPRLSSRAIASHVSEGAEMAREYHLPQPIIDGIVEHHGTLLIGFFYQEAVEQQKHGDVREEDFRYPGPKPQSSETAILMICDAVESGVRTIKNP